MRLLCGVALHYPPASEKGERALEKRDDGSWHARTLISALLGPAGGMLWNMMRSWLGSGRPTSTLSTSHLDQGNMNRNPVGRPKKSLLKVSTGDTLDQP